MSGENLLLMGTFAPGVVTRDITALGIKQLIRSTGNTFIATDAITWWVI